MIIYYTYNDIVYIKGFKIEKVELEIY